MKIASFALYIFFTIFFIVGCGPSADWSTSFIVWNGYMYEVSEDDIDEIDEVIGKVTKFADREGAYYGNFSNVYKKGTKFYSIRDIPPSEAIAVKVNDKYRKLIQTGKYDGN